ncbi:MAG: restriction endonuclease subunit R [Armatimonadetes bacterium CG_4_10_14_3_um_filter_66_18]|nr:DEAD/DEAH box helicase family protein [Armatimonadota bacterium]PIX47699.1 MAG: restriction endonuclease subunit R [Armatimonadetes bacterium CG_4_8_14_3_um_filter_66_20]PIY54301.1 MAG: restriction endonuclease subunit R [Armatimonadetes bacterium CG_4_10_14_3_um_filter_66_18]PIZ32705.1 MAG: restriction endonuclease subunit R [Armatimonadetes bacterium CG_4_10_14_0_8_um_filter_66_14]NCO93985.1 DEAD/DEAH box helicase family protein [Armatimonadota bacterium]
MQLKDYQTDVLESLSRYLQVLVARRERAEKVARFLAEQGEQAELADFCREAWEALHADEALPLIGDTHGNRVAPPYIARKDGLGRPVPNVCLKIPTGGGKTLLGTVAVERINTEYFKTQTGLVLWIVPSDAIYKQTWKAFANREHPYRQMLERASGGRVRLLEKSDRLTKQDVAQQLCVMLLMLQAGAVRKESKEARKMFQDSGKFPSFFPDVDDPPANAELLAQVPNLDVNTLTDEDFHVGGLSPKHSLGNVLRLVRPLVLIDEGHKAYSDIALETIAGYNPCFLLELSATPNSGRGHVSNVLVNVTGTALKNEEMIKLPINLINEGRADWKHTLAVAQEKLNELWADAERMRNNEGRYVRPLLVIRVERTGKEQRDKAALHSEDVREYLVEKLGAHPDEVKVKSAELDELDKVDLPSELCPVRYIITKDALREGWDCPFAYVLAVLSKTTATTALTQMIGRVLRQPGAELTGVQSLNECYVYTFDQEVQAAVESVRRGLQEEGMGDLADNVRAAGTDTGAVSRRETIHRRPEFAGLRIFMPRVLSRHYATREWRLFDYDRDLLSRLDWDQFTFTNRTVFTPDEQAAIERTLARVDVDDLAQVGDAELPSLETFTEDVEPELDFPALVRLLLDVIPNPWQGARILEETLTELRKRGIAEERIYTTRLFLVKAMRDDLKAQVNRAAEVEFRQMLAEDELSFRLDVSNDPKLNWELAETLELDVTDDDKVLLRRNAESLERSLFKPVYQKQLNGLEKDVAWYLDGDKAVRWWHRIAVHQDWHLQGWQRNRVYPDFLACLHDAGDGKVRFTVLETKGLHLKGNEDTEYKAKLFELLTEHGETAVSVGELKVGLQEQQMRFELLLEDSWRETLPAVLG